MEKEVRQAAAKSCNGNCNGGVVRFLRKRLICSKLWLMLKAKNCICA